MLAEHPLVAFVLVTDPTRARAFYEGTLGLRFLAQDDYAVVFDAKGVSLRLTIMPNHKPAQHTVLGWNVPDIAAAARHLMEAGIRFEKYSFLPQDDLGIWTAPDAVSKVAWFKDPDGNILSISQH
ncbi:MAG: VOC family protein [Bryobacteraceae bacterium]|nr:VOC family protein [Bryobacteraceae bacterium]